LASGLAELTDCTDFKSIETDQVLCKAKSILIDEQKTIGLGLCKLEKKRAKGDGIHASTITCVALSVCLKGSVLNFFFID
jgi:hypothetical protein